jgi:fatty-acyl-CoA synthase
MKQNNLKFTTFKSTTIGGSACPPAMMKTLRDDFGVRVQHGWGMTEMSPVGTIGTPKSKHRDWTADQRMALALKQGRPPFGVEMKAVDAEGRELPRDGVSAGDVMVRGPWVVRDYFKSDARSPLSADGWFPTGDVGAIDGRRLPDDHRTARRTSSSPAASGSARSNSRTSQSATHRCSRPR